jgi:hypothetical protein
MFIRFVVAGGRLKTYNLLNPQVVDAIVEVDFAPARKECQEKQEVWAMSFRSSANTVR